MVIYNINAFYIPEEVKPKNANYNFRCSICDRKIPRDNPYCYKCRQEYQISQDGVFKNSIPTHEKARLDKEYADYTEDKKFPNKCRLCRKNKVKVNDGVCTRCLNFILSEEEE